MPPILRGVIDVKQIAVVADDKVGVLADISYILGKSKINIESLSVVSMERKAVLVFFVKDEKRACQLLKANGYNVLESEIIIARIHDQPGELSKLSSILAKAGVNILNLYVIAREHGESVVALRVDKTAKAKKLLSAYASLES